MNPKKLVAAGTIAALMMGGLAVTASAQSSDEEPTTTTAEAETDNGSESGEGRSNGKRGCKGRSLETAATTIGIDQADLKAALEEGSTIADVAEANGVDAQTVIDALVEARTERIAERVENGRLTQEEADEKLADLETKITDRVNGVEKTES